MASGAVAQPISTFAGDGTFGSSGDGGPATSAQLGSPIALTFDNAGNLYFSDEGNSRIRRITPAGMISTYAGTTTGFSGDGGPATAAQISGSYGLAVDNAGSLYFADTFNNRIRKITSGGIISTVAGDGTNGFGGDGGAATAAQLAHPRGVAIDATGNLYIADTDNQRIRKVTSTGTITTVAGNGTAAFGGDGGPATAAQIWGPLGMAIDAAGSLYFGDASNARIRKIDAGGIISTITGDGTFGFSGDGGPAAAAQINPPEGLTTDSAGNLYFSDASNNRVRIVNTSGIISTVAGDGTAAFGGDGGPATSAQFNWTGGLAMDAVGNLYIGDTYNFRIRKVSYAGAPAPAPALPHNVPTLSQWGMWLLVLLLGGARWQLLANTRQGHRQGSQRKCL